MEEHTSSQIGAKKAELEKKAEAKEILQKGSKATSQEMDHLLQQKEKKKEEREKKAQASEILQKGVAAAQAVKEDKSEVAKEAPAAKEEPAVLKEEPKKEEPVAKQQPANDDDIPQLEEIDEEIPELETAQTASVTQQQAEGGSSEKRVENRNEKKARKMMTRLGMRPVPNIARCTLKAGGGRGYFFIDDPDVFVTPGGKNDTYVIFGEAKQGGTGGGFGSGAAPGVGVDAAQAQAAMAQQKAASIAAKNAVLPSQGKDEQDAIPEMGGGGGAAAASEDVDGISAKDIDLVMGQASCSRAKAVNALKENDGDLVNAIMSLTM
jgi:nascent polypeptide-associated complex subunit alpha